jgi:hypothetical protein
LPEREQQEVFRVGEAYGFSFMTRAVRFGVVCGSTKFQAWQARCILKLLELDGVECALLVTPGRDASARRPAPRDESLRASRKGILSRLATVAGGTHLWNRYVQRAVKRLDAAREVDVQDVLGDVPTLSCDIMRHAASRVFSQQDVETVASHELDFMLLFNFGIVRGEILRAARYGLWSFHHGDEEKYRGSPAGFWEIYNGEPVTGAILQRLTDRLDAGIVLHKGHFKTEANYGNLLNVLLFGTSDWPARVCRQIQNDDPAIENAEASQSKAPVYRSPGNLRLAALLVRRKLARLKALLSDLVFEKREQWNVGIVHAPVHSFLEADFRPQVTWLRTPPPDEFFADGFGLTEGDKLTILFEAFDYKRGKANIQCVTATGAGPVGPQRIAFDLGVHLSYPYVFPHEGHVYCVPESFELGKVVLLKAREFPTVWEQQAVLIQDIELIDPTILRYDGLWWLFGTLRGDGHIRIDDMKLFAWYSKELPGPWSQHALNPLKTDVRNSRPAGTFFFHENRLYRPAQDSSRTYGGRIVIHRVDALSPTVFAETACAVVEPFQDWPMGIHTISAAGEYTVIDGKRELRLRRSLAGMYRRAANLRKRSLSSGP